MKNMKNMEFTPKKPFTSNDDIEPEFDLENQIEGVEIINGRAYKQSKDSERPIMYSIDECNKYLLYNRMLNTFVNIYSTHGNLVLNKNTREQIVNGKSEEFTTSSLPKVYKLSGNYVLIRNVTRHTMNKRLHFDEDGVTKIIDVDNYVIDLDTNKCTYENCQGKYNRVDNITQGLLVFERVDDVEVYDYINRRIVSIDSDYEYLYSHSDEILFRLINTNNIMRMNYKGGKPKLGVESECDDDEELDIESESESDTECKPTKVESESESESECDDEPNTKRTASETTHKINRVITRTPDTNPNIDYISKKLDAILVFVAKVDARLDAMSK